MDLTMILVGIGVTLAIACVGLALMPSAGREAEERLEGLAGGGRRGAKPGVSLKDGILLRPKSLESTADLKRFIPSLDGLAALYDQADVSMPFRRFLLIPVVLATIGSGLGLAYKLPIYATAGVAASLGLLPLMWLKMRKRKRIKVFTSQMPDALELVGRALRAGHGLASGMHVVAEEMGWPIAMEFGRVYEEQNLGIALEESLRGMADRVPTMDVRFFVTAVVIQRATGGDLAEILDKIGRLVRERFQILGQVQALTAEGRLSGVVLLALPPGLLAFTYMTNPGYTGLLFSTPVGVKLLAGAAFMQVLGAVAIKKIITIKV
jgi:tight adherence protein B